MGTVLHQWSARAAAHLIKRVLELVEQDKQANAEPGMGYEAQAAEWRAKLEDLESESTAAQSDR